MATRLHRELSKSPVARKGIGCLAVLCVIVALLTGYASWLRLAHARSTGAWIPAQGTIERSGVEETLSNGQTCFMPKLTYRFEVDGKICRGDRIRPTEQSSANRTAAEEAIAPYAVGGDVTIYYDPHDPANSVLRPGAEREDYLMLALPLLFLFFAYGFYQMLRRARAVPLSDEPETTEPAA